MLFLVLPCFLLFCFFFSFYFFSSLFQRYIAPSSAAKKKKKTRNKQRLYKSHILKNVLHSASRSSFSRIPLFKLLLALIVLFLFFLSFFVNVARGNADKHIYQLGRRRAFYTHRDVRKANGGARRAQKESVKQINK